MENCMNWGVVTKSISTIYEGAFTEKERDGQRVSAIADEGLHGMLVEITGEEEEGYVPVRTFYGYTGYMLMADLCPMSRERAMCWEDSNLWVVSGSCVDVVSVPKVQGVRLKVLFRGSLVQVVSWDSEEVGWARVCLADGSLGYMRNQYLWEKKFSQRGVWERQVRQIPVREEKRFREAVVETAKTYLGTQYRWGGRSTAGIDCSGLTSVSYMLNGILIFRDAKIVEGYPVHEIHKADRKPGDLLYFPGHIAMYVGEGRYLHSTGKVGSGGVVCNSLDPNSAEYRKDLADSLYAVGSIF